MHMVLYERNYISIKDMEEKFKNSALDNEKEIRPIEELYEKVRSASKIPIPGRDDRVIDFIDMACKASSDYMVSMKLILFEDRIHARYTLEDGVGTLKFMTGLLEMSDTASFYLDGDTLVIALDFYTSATYLDGRLLIPEPWEI
ncbi:MAG: hypothetical protein ACLUGW_05830 [Oscillospiraceae bacterium]